MTPADPPEPSILLDIQSASVLAKPVFIVVQWWEYSVSSTAPRPSTVLSHTAFVGLGSNLGESAQTLSDAVLVLHRTPGVQVVKVSSLYYTAPVGGVEQPEYCNQAVEIHTSLGPVELLNLLLATEAQFGRVRKVHWGPRTLDLDLLFYDQQTLELPTLTLPHPRIGERGFVLAPLLELEPDWMHPVLGSTVKQLYVRWVEQVGKPQDHIRRLASLCPLASPGES